MIRYAKTILGAVALALILTAPLAADEPRKGPAKGKPIDVVICLDTSNSMDGLIASAKLKLWDIVNELSQVKPTPDLRVGLYSYGNDGYDAKAGWVRKEIELTTDLDAIYQKLNGLTTNGGTEFATRVCRDALDQLKWSEDKNALKIIFVCGNEPASQDKQNRMAAVAEKAIAKGVVINTIYCGKANDADARDWKQFAELAKGKFASIDQERSKVVIETPHDKELAELSDKLSTTYVLYGNAAKDKAENQRRQDVNAYQAGIAAAATRAYSKTTGLYRNADWDLVDRLKEEPKLDISKIPDDQLCETLKKMKPEERVKHVKEMAAKREALQKQIQDLSAKRQAYVNEQLRKNPSAADKAFDAAIRGALREQAADKGIKIPEDGK